MDDRPTAAARNNAQWCDLVCRSDGLATRFDDDAWTCSSRTPAYYPDAVTLGGTPSVADLLARVDGAPEPLGRLRRVPQELFPDSALVGYESGTRLAAARAVRFEIVGPLRVWIRSPRGDYCELSSSHRALASSNTRRVRARSRGRSS